jgi:hypothetical protein
MNKMSGSSEIRRLRLPHRFAVSWAVPFSKLKAEDQACTGNGLVHKSCLQRTHMVTHPITITP